MMSWIPFLSSFLAQRLLPSSTLSIEEQTKYAEEQQRFWNQTLPLTKENIENFHGWILSLLPASLDKLNQKIRKIRGSFTPRPFQINSPDKALIEGIFFQNSLSSKIDIPTIILFPASGELYSMGCFAWLLDAVNEEWPLFHLIVFTLFFRKTYFRSHV